MTKQQNFVSDRCINRNSNIKPPTTVHSLQAQQISTVQTNSLPFFIPLSSPLLSSYAPEKMVSKISKNTPKRSPKKFSKNPSPEKSIAVSSSSSSISLSFLRCRRKLLKIFARFAILTPSNPKNLGFRRLEPISLTQNLLPPPSSPSKKTIFLDLDETLVHSKTNPSPERFDFTIYPKIDGQLIPFYVIKRPGVDEFLKKAAEKFEVVVFTAGLREYASLVINLLDPKGEVISHRLYRDSCREMGGKFVKDLSEVGRDLGNVAIVDDNPSSYLLQVGNAVPVKAFVGDLGDKELRRVMEFFEVACRFDDMRDAVKSFLINGEDI